MSHDESSVLKIGRYQLENLLRERIGFIYLDLRAPETRAKQGVGHVLLNGSRSVAPEAAVEAVREICRSEYGANQVPIVLICENGSKSVAVARELERNSYLNVYVIDGGVGGLNLDQF